MKNTTNSRNKDSKEIRNYIFWGIISAGVNIGIFRILVLVGLDYKVANIITLVINRFFCYFTNKFFVFKTKSENFISMMKEMLFFFLSRFVSFLMDYFGVIIMVEFLKMNETVGKITIALIVIISNYVFSKFLVFNKGNKRKGQNETNNSNSLL